MNREILFRGFHEDVTGKTVITVDGVGKRGEWLHGNLVEDSDGSFIVQEKESRSPWQIEEVVPQTVGQFTGLCDKNGKRIFEGDIVKAICRFDGANMYVEYDSSVATFCLFDKDKIGFKYLCDIHNREVIGNIFESPDLIGSESNG